MDKTEKNLHHLLTLTESAWAVSSDEVLIDAASKGEEAAFREIFIRHHRRVAGIVGRFFSRPERVEELAQDVFTKLYFASGQFCQEKGKPFTVWLTSIAINVCYDELRRQRRRPETLVSEMTVDEVAWLSTRLKAKDSGDAETALVMRDLAHKLLARLCAEDRIVLTLLDVEQLSVSEIATLMDWTVAKVKIRVYRARIALRNILHEFQ